MINKVKAVKAHGWDNISVQTIQLWKKELIYHLNVSKCWWIEFSRRTGIKLM